MVANASEVNGVGVGSWKYVNFCRHLSVSRHSHACIVAKVKKVKSGYWVCRANDNTFVSRTNASHHAKMSKNTYQGFLNMFFRDTFSPQ